MLNFFIMVSVVNLVLYFVSKARLKEVVKKHGINFSLKANLLTKIKGKLVYFLPILNVVGLMILVVFIFCEEKTLLFLIEEAKKKSEEV